MATVIPEARRREMIARAEEFYGLAPGAGLAEPAGRRGYPGVLVPRRTGAGTTGGGSAGDGARLDPSVIESAWTLYRCLTVRADAIAGLPVRLWRGRGEDASEIDSGPLWDLFDRVNPHWDLSLLLGMTEWSLNTSRRGAFWILDGFDAQDRPTEIWWADPRQVRAVRGKTTDDPEKWYISHFEVAQPGATGGKPKEYPPEHVVWFRAPSPLDEFANMPALAAAIESAGLALAGMHANKMLHESGMTGAGYVVPADDNTVWSDDERSDIASMFATTVKGRAGWHRMLVANRRDFEVRDLKFLSPRDLQFAQQLELTDRQICIATGVPKPLVEPTDSTFSNVDGARGILWSSTLIPRATLIAGAIKRQIVMRHFAGEADQVELWTGDIPELQDDAAAKWALDSQQLSAMLDLADRVARGYDRAAALKAAVFYIACPEDVASVIIPEPPAAAMVALDDAPRELPQLEEVRLLLSAVAEGKLSRMSAIAILELIIGDRARAEAIVADTGTGIETAPVAEISEARTVVSWVVEGKVPPRSAVALLTRLFGDPAAAAAVVADARPMAALPAEDGAAAGTQASSMPIRPASGRGAVIVYRGGRGYRVLDDGGAVPLDGLGGTAGNDSLSGDDDHDNRAGDSDIRVYGSDAHRRAWEDEIARIEDRAGPIGEIVVDLLGGQASEAERGVGRLSDADVTRIVDAAGVDLDDPSDDGMAALAAALSVAVLGRAFGPRWIERGSRAMNTGLAALAPAVADETLAAIGVDVAIDLAEGSPMARMLLERAARFAEQTTSTSWLRVGEVLARGVRDGDDLRGLAKRVAALGEEWRGSRAMMVAWTETHSASQAVALETVRTSGVAARRTWLSALDDRVRDDHVDAHGQTVGLDESYTVGGEPCAGPGNCGSPAQDIRCRCVERWEVAD